MNLWWKHGKDFFRYDYDIKKYHNSYFPCKRTIPPMKKGKILTLLGPRQVGKTTLVKHVVMDLIDKGTASEKIIYLSLDRLQGSHELRDALRYLRSPEYIFLDEASQLKGASNEIKILVDSGGLEKTSMLVTGSSPAEILYSKEPAPGRGMEGGYHYLRPLSFRDYVACDVFFMPQRLHEFDFDDEKIASVLNLLKVISDIEINLTSNTPGEIYDKARMLGQYTEEINMLFEMYLQTGGFPLASSHFIKRKLSPDLPEDDDAIEQIFVRYVMGDLGSFGKSQDTLRGILSRVLRSYGSRFSFNRLARDTEGSMSVPTVKSYIDFMEKSLLFNVVYAVDLDRKEPAFRKEKKVYLADPFVYYSFQAFLKGKPREIITFDAMHDEELTSVLAEGIVSSHLLTHMEIPYAKEAVTLLGFHYDRQGKEIDFVVKRNDERYMGIEVKYGRSSQLQTPRCPRSVNGLIILTKEVMKEENNRIRIPLSLFLLMLPRSRAHL